MPKETQGTKKTYDSSIENFYKKLIIGDGTSTNLGVSDEEIILVEYFNQKVKDSEYLPNFKQGELRKYLATNSGERIKYNDLIQGIFREYNIPPVNNSDEENLIKNCISTLMNTEVDIPFHGKNKILTEDGNGYIKIINFPTDPKEAKTINEKIKEVFRDCKKKLKCQKVISEQYASNISVRKSGKNTFEILKNNKVETSFNLTNQDLQTQKIFLLNGIIKKLTYHSASDLTEIFIEQDVVYVSDLIIPKSIYNKMLKELPQIIKQAFSNYYMYLSSNNVEFYDSNNRKYQFPINNIHVLGLTANFFKNESNIELAKGLVLQHNSSLNLYEVLDLPIEEIHELRKIELDDLILSRNTKISSDMTETINKMIENIKLLKQTQKRISDLMIKKDEDSQMELLSWLIYRELEKNLTEKEKREIKFMSFDTMYINPQYKERINKIISSIFEKELYRFDKKFVDTVKEWFLLNGVEMYQLSRDRKVHLFDFYIKFDKIYTKRKKSITTKYNYLQNIQDYLISLSQNYSQLIISLTPADVIHVEPFKNFTSTSISKQDIREYFFEEKEYSSSESGLGMGYFGLAQAAISKTLTEVYTQDNFNSPINLFKIFDKLSYLCCFNYLLDVNKIYISDQQKIKIEGNNADQPDTAIIIEMEALNELLLGYFEQINKDGVAKFFSVENSADTFVIPSAYRNSEIILGLCQTKEHTKDENTIKIPTSNIITQKHNEAKEKYRSGKELIKALKQGEVILRYATSFDVKGNFSQEESPLLERIFQKTPNYTIFNTAESIKMNLSSAIKVKRFVEDMNSDNLYDLFNLTVTSEEFDEIKLLLVCHFNKIISNLIQQSIDNSINIDEELNTEEYDYPEKLKLELLNLDKTNDYLHATQHLKFDIVSHDLVQAASDIRRNIISILHSINIANGYLETNNSSNSAIDLLNELVSINAENSENFKESINVLPDFAYRVFKRNIFNVDFSITTDEMNSVVKTIIIIKSKEIINKKLTVFLNDFIYFKKTSQNPYDEFEAIIKEVFKEEQLPNTFEYFFVNYWNNEVRIKISKAKEFLNGNKIDYLQEIEKQEEQKFNHETREEREKAWETLEKAQFNRIDNYHRHIGF